MRGSLGQLARGNQFALRDVELVRDDLQVALQLLIDFVFLGETLAEGLTGLFGGHRGLLQALGLIESAPAQSQSDKGKATQDAQCQPYPARRSEERRVGKEGRERKWGD